VTTRLATTLATLLLAGGQLLAQPAAGSGAASPSPWANKLFLDDIATNPSQPAPAEIAFDFGTVPKGTLCVHKFTITNVYAVPMQVTDIRRTSETVQAYPPQKVLQANDRGEFIVTVDTSRFTGVGTETVQVSVGPTNVSTATLRVTATSRADVMLSPGSFNFGVVSPGSTETKSVTLEYTGKQKDWAVTGHVAPTGPFEVVTADGGRGKTKISVTLKTNVGSASGSFNDFLQLLTNDPATPVVNVAINGTLQAPVAVTPDKVNFGAVRLGETKSIRVYVRGNGVGPFKIEPFADAGDGLSVQTIKKPAPVQVVVVEFTPVAVGDYAKDLKLTMSLKGGATVNLTVTATVVP